MLLSLNEPWREESVFSICTEDRWSHWRSSFTTRLRSSLYRIILVHLAGGYMRSTILLNIKHTLVHIEALFGARSRVGSSSQSNNQDESHESHESHEVLDTPYRLFVQGILGVGNYCLDVTHPNPNPNRSNRSERGRTSVPESNDSLPVLLSM